MQQIAPTRLNKPPARRGFTLIELLVVITIISILAALTVRVVVAFISEGREAATKATISKINRLVEMRMQAFYRRYGRTDATTQTRLRNTAEFSALRTLSVNDNVKLILTRKLLFMKHFPQTREEIDAALQPELANKRTQADNAEILYDFLVRSAVLGETPVANDAFNANEVADPDGDGFPEFVDAWGRPIRFYRWPTRLFRPDGPGTGPDVKYAQMLFSTYPSNNDLKRDPDDPMGLVGRAFSNFESGAGIVGTGFHTPQTFHTPLVISAGRDAEFGMFPPEDGPSKSTYGYLAAIDAAKLDAVGDNITSLNVRAGGK
jgi:prepilin-type N-terminal cleavage/methylation domain-containing protein